MKRKTWIMLIIIALFFTMTLGVSSYAASEMSLSFSPDSQVIKPGEEISINVIIKNIPAGKNLALGYEAELEYDPNVFEGVSFIAKNGWTASSDFENSSKFSEDIVIENSTGTEADTVIGVLKLKAKMTMTETQKSIIKINNVLLTDGDNDYRTTATIDVEVTPSEQKPDNTVDNTTTDEVTDIESKDNTITKTNTIGGTSDQTTANQKIPAAGINIMVVILTMVILITAVFGIIRYKKIKLK